MLTTSASAQKNGNGNGNDGNSLYERDGVVRRRTQHRDTTPPPGDPVNHHVLPTTIEVKEGGVVNFVVAGVHQIFVYKSHVRLEDIQALEPTTTGTFIDVALSDLLYSGIHPLVAPPANSGLSNARNRVESVSFAEKGTYLVICNIRGHFRDGMYAIVKVTG